MITDEGLMEVSEIFGTFDLEEIRSVVKDQILGDEEVSAPHTYNVDHFHPLYVEFLNIIEKNNNPDIIRAVNARFTDICNIFLDALKEKYCITITDDWKEMHPNEISAVVIALYDFLIIHHQDNIEEVLYNYIIKNKEELYAIFEPMKGKKDASTLAYKKHFSPEISLIFSNIYDICTYVLDHISPKDFIDYMDKDYVPVTVLKSLYESGDIGGVFGDEYPLNGKDFTDCIAETFHANTSYKGTICFNVVNQLRNWAESQPALLRNSDSE